MPDRQALVQPPSARDARLQRLRDLYPEAAAEGGLLDLQRLADLLPPDAVDDRVERGVQGTERYGLSWNGKRAAQLALAAAPSGTLAPCPERSMNWETTRNVFIEGENLETLRIMLKPYFGQVKMIYIDPPYNTGNDFIYPDDFKAPLARYLQATGQADALGNLLVSNPETSGRYHSAWLSMMYPRLALARELLRDDGVLFCSIDDHEVHNLRLLLNEVFGEENCAGILVWKGATDNNPTRVAVEHEYILVYCKSIEATPAYWPGRASDAKEAILEQYRKLRRTFGADDKAVRRRLRAFIRANESSLAPLTHYTRVDSHGPFTGSRKVHNPHPGGYRYDVPHPSTGLPCVMPANGYRYPWATMKQLLDSDRVIFGADETQVIQIKEYLEDYVDKLTSVIAYDARTAARDLAGALGERNVFDTPKPEQLLRRISGFVTSGSDLALDFFAGSCTTAHAVMQLNREDGGNRRYIMVQLPEETGRDDYAAISDIGLERIRRVAAKIEAEQAGKLDLDQRAAPLDLGVRVFRLAASQLARWQAAAGADEAAYTQLLLTQADPLAQAADADALLWELALREGLPLDCRVETLTVGPLTIHRLSDPGSDRRLHVCLDARLALDDLRDLPLDPEDRLVCREAALADDATAQNLALRCQLVTV